MSGVVFFYIVDFQFQSVSKQQTSFCSEWNDTLEMLLVRHFRNAVVDIYTFHICVVFEPLMASTNKIAFVQKEILRFSFVWGSHRFLWSRSIYFAWLPAVLNKHCQYFVVPVISGV